MRKIKEVLRLHFEHRQPARQIAKSCSIACSTVQEYLPRAHQAAIPWPLPEGMDDTTLENRLFPFQPPVGLNPLDWTECVRVADRILSPERGQKGSCHEVPEKVPSRVQTSSH